MGLIWIDEKVPPAHFSDDESRGRIAEAAERIST
jgi:hypothetical protein